MLNQLLGKTVDGVLSSFTKTLADLKEISDKRNESAKEKTAKASELITSANEDLAEAKRATDAADAINKAFGNVLNIQA